MLHLYVSDMYLPATLHYIYFTSSDNFITAECMCKNQPTVNIVPGFT